MAYRGLKSFIRDLERENEVSIVTEFSDPVLEIAEITDRISKSGGKALLFTNNGTDFPLLINSYGSSLRLSMALGGRTPEESAREIETFFAMLASSGSLSGKLTSIPGLLRMASYMPKRSSGKGSCQEVINLNPDLGILPVLKCWPHDGGRFITLPMVHTLHPETGKTNVGMYRMQILDKSTTAMHWQRHKTGAGHFEAWKALGRRMPVSVSLGGDPVYAYSATAPLPEDINEFVLAGFLRKKKVSLVKCITNGIYVPEDADIVLEGYVDPSEEAVWEGPFGDHTGFYSLADWYPRFHVTCITHRRDAVYPATIVGIPPMEDAYLAMATEKIFLSPVRLALSPEVIDFHMPEAGTAHNLVIVRIRKSYPGQGLKVINSLFGAGQMMFSKYIIVVSSDTDIRNYKQLAADVLRNTDPASDIVFTRGPLDVLDHASGSFSFGGKAGIDATVKLPEERELVYQKPAGSIDLKKDQAGEVFFSFNMDLPNQDIPVVIVSVNQAENRNAISDAAAFFSGPEDTEPSVILAVDHTVDVKDYFIVAWQVLANTDPLRDHLLINGKTLFIDGTVKAFAKGGFPRKWPNPVCSDNATIGLVDKKWSSYGLGPFIGSPSARYMSLLHKGNEEIIL